MSPTLKTEPPVRRVLVHVRADYRKAVVTAVLALAAFAAGHLVGGPSAHGFNERVAAYACTGAFVIFGVIATRLVADELSRVSSAKAGVATAGPLRVGALLVGYAFVLFLALGMLAFPVGHLLVGGAITGVVVGIAAQQALGNVFAGLVLLFTRPYVPGERILVRSGALNGPFTGTVTGVGLLYTTVDTADGPTNIPNSQLLASAVGPAPSDDADDHERTLDENTNDPCRDS
jgi:small-conductance mechanosensitive channel